MGAQRMNSLNESVFVCAYDECSATFSTGTRLEWHMRTHSGERPFECSFPNCGKKYTRRFHLTRHVRTSHTARTAPAEKTFTCQHDECDKVFSSQHSLYKHVRFSHEKRKFQCPHCLKTFIKHQHLSVHSYEHTKVLPFQCTEPGCDKAFLLPSRLKVHQRSHKGYPCNVEGCDQVFEKWTLLRRHHKVDHQKSFTCTSCNRIFYSKSNLEAHTVTHNTERETFCCPFEGCCHFYLQERNLRDHIRKAHENKRFACDVPGCTRTFFAKQSLKRHKVSHDPNKPLPAKKRNKPPRKSRKKGYPTKSAAAVLSGCSPPPEEDKKLLVQSTQLESVPAQSDSECYNHGLPPMTVLQALASSEPVMLAEVIPECSEIGEGCRVVLNLDLIPSEPIQEIRGCVVATES